MSERLFTRPCPQCGAVCEYSASSCARCSFAFSQHSPKRLHAKLIVTVLAAVFLFDAIVLLVICHRRVTGASVYSQAIALAQTSSDVQKALGDGIQPRFPAIGWVRGDDASRFSVFSVHLRGSRGKGTLYGVANSVHGLWELSRLSLRLEGNGQDVDIASAPRRLSWPPVPKKKIFLIPIGLDPNESLSWAPAYYQLKMGIDVQVLAHDPLPEGVEVPARHQVDSERLVEHIRRAYRVIADDPSNILIAVTSRDIFIRSYGWAFSENYRQDGRFAVLSSAGLHPTFLLDRWNHEWLRSRLQKILTKNIAMLYFDLPMSADYTSLLSGGVLTGSEIDSMSGAIYGLNGRWNPIVNSDDIEVNIYKMAGKPPLWRLAHAHHIPPQTNARVFGADVTIGVFYYRKTDFYLTGDWPLQFTRVYGNKDTQARPFGIGANDSLDIFLVGQMGRYIELIFEDGARVHFAHVPTPAGQSGDTYQAGTVFGSPFSRARAIFLGDIWTVQRTDGWKFYFPYRPNYPGANVTVLTGFADPSAHKYEMIRNDAGDLLSVTTPSSQWLHFTRDARHRVSSISDSTGRIVNYQYDAGGRLSLTSDSDGQLERYTYDDKAQMLSVTVGSDPPLVINTYDISGNITSQRMSDGGAFQYHYTRDVWGRSSAVVPDLITHPNGLLTHLEYDSDGYAQSLPIPPVQ